MQEPIIEICVDSIESALAAEKGGADRIELCTALSEGGLTPGPGLIQACRKNLALDIFVLIRPRRGDFLYSANDFEIMKKDIQAAKDFGARGVVFGILKEDGHIDIERTSLLVELAKPLSVTFHRAFDLTPDPFKALNDLMLPGIERVLTSGQVPTALQGATLIKELVTMAGENLIILPGGGINSKNIKEIISKTGVKECHASARKKITSKMKYKREHLPMGTTSSLSEYDLMIADYEEIKAIREALKS